MELTGNSKANIIVVGAGGLGKKWAATTAKNPRGSLAAIVDTDQARGQTVAKELEVPFFASVEHVPAESYDAAIIAVPHLFLASTGKKILSLGKHAFIEKPVALNTTDLGELIIIAGEKNLRLMPGYNHRFLSHIAKAKKMVDSGVIGELMFIRARHGASGKVGYEKEWRHKKEMGGGINLDLTVHTLDLARWFLGNFTEVKSISGNLFWGSEVGDNAFLVAKTAAGKMASLHASWTHWKPIFSFEIYGKDGYILVEGLSKYMQKEQLVFGKRSPDFLGSKVQETVEEFNTDPDLSLDKELNEFISAITEGRDPKPDAYDALETLKVIENI